MTDFPDLKLKAYPVFPVQVQAASPILLDTTNGVYSFSLNEDQLREDIGAPTMADLNAATKAAQDAAAQAAASAAALGNQVHQYDTRALASAATIPSGVALVSVLGWSAAGDFGGGLYKKLGGAPASVRSWHFHSVDGAWWQLVEVDVNPRMFGAAGNNVVDDRQAMQDADDYLNTFFTGGVVEGVPGDIYRVVINGGVTDFGLIWRYGIDHYGHGATINLECTGSVYGIRPLGRNKITGWNFRVPVSTGLGSSQSIYHSCISFGCAYGDGGTVASPSIYCAPSDIEVWGNTFYSTQNSGNGTMLGGYGGGDNIHIHDNVFLDSNTIAIAIGFDWLPQGAIDESNLNATKAAYLATPRTAQTLHWTNVRIHDNRIGNMTMPATLSSTAPNSPVFGSHGIRLSGVVSYDVRNNRIEQTTYCGVFITGGDLALEYANVASLRYLAFRNCFVSGNAVRVANSGYGVYVECTADNIYRSATDPADPQYPYSPIYLTVYPTNIVVENNFTLGSSSAAVLEGLLLGQMIGGVVRGNIALFHKNGIRIADGAKEIKVIAGNEIFNNREAGILVSGSSVPPRSITVDGNRVFANCSTGAGAAGNICMDQVLECVVTNNDVGENDVTADAIVNTSNAVRTTIRGNRIFNVKSGGSALKLAQPLTTVLECHGNTWLGSGIYISGLDIVPVRREASTANISGNAVGFITEYVAKASAISGGAPTFGTYVVGDRIWIEDAASGGVKLLDCTVAGTSGTWKVGSTLS
jgi:hypothetical protein